MKIYLLGYREQEVVKLVSCYGKNILEKVQTYVKGAQQNLFKALIDTAKKFSYSIDGFEKDKQFLLIQSDFKNLTFNLNSPDLNIKEFESVLEHEVVFIDLYYNSISHIKNHQWVHQDYSINEKLLNFLENASRDEILYELKTKLSNSNLNEVEEYFSELLSEDYDLIREWLKIGFKNSWIKRAYDPPFTSRSFYKCNITELKEKLQNDNWCLSQAFYYIDGATC